MSAIEEFKKLLAEAQRQQRESITEVVEGQPNADVSVPAKAAEYLSRSRSKDNIPTSPENIEAQRWNDPLRREPNEKFVTFKEMNDHYGLFLQRIQQQMSTIGGGGEVNLRYLDDVDRSTIGPNRHLAYNPTTRKFFFEPVTSSEPQVQSDWSESDTGDVAFIKNKPTNLSDFNNDAGFISSADGGDADQLDGQEGSYYLDYSNFTNTPDPLEDDDYTTSIANNVISVINLPANTAIGPVEQLSFNTSHTHQEERVVGTLCWDPDDQTLNLTHPNDVVQQIGQELYAYVRNGTANTIVNGTVVQFSGAEQNGSARLLVSPMLGDGTYPNLYGLGVATHDIESGEDGRVTVWGKVRGLDMSEFSVGDVLYVSANTAGGFTNDKPRAPNNVIPIAAVLNNSADAGEIFVRPTIDQKMSYGVFVRTTDFTNSALNTANTIPLTSTEVSNGVTLGTDGNASQMSVDQSGLYQIDWTIHFNTSGGTFDEDTWYTWLRKNGTDIPNTMRRGGIDGEIPNGLSPSFTRCVLLDANDYIEVCTAVSNTRVSLDAAAATAFGPATASLEVSIAQIQL